MAGATVAHGDVVKHTKPTAINYIAAMFAAIGSFLFGYDSGIIGSVTSPAFTYFQEYYGTYDPVSNSVLVSANLVGAIVSLFAAGAFFGALLAGWTADKLGRKRTIQLGSLIAAVGCAIQTGALNVGGLIAGRFIAGFSIGVLSMIVPVFQAEISPPHARGLMSGFTQASISLGFLVANWVGYGCERINGQGQFRVPLGIQIIPAVILFFGMFILPYSPRWLAKKGRHEEARQTLIRLHGGRRTANVEIVEAEFQEMLTQIAWENENVSTSYLDCFKGRANIHRTLCGCLVQAMCQWTGINVNAYFGPRIYQSLGFSGATQLLINGISGAWGFVITVIFITCIVDTIGRRKPLIIGAVFMAICYAWQGALISRFSNGNVGSYSEGVGGVAASFVYSWAFSWSYGPVSWIYQAECFSMPLRGVGGGLATASNWLNNVIIGQITPIGLQNLGWKYFIVFICTNISNSVVAYFLFPETKGKTLEEIGLLFGDTNVRVMPTGVIQVPAHGDGMTKVDHAHDEEKVMGGNGPQVEHRA